MMSPDGNGTVAGRTLNGWKDIAGYLGKSVRSVQRWEATLGLPVHRIRTEDGQIVYALTDEVDAWRRQLDHTPSDDQVDLQTPEGAEAVGEPQPAAALLRPISSSRRLQIAAGISLFIAGASVGSWLSRPANAAVEIKFVGQAIEAIGRDGRVAWTRTFESIVMSTPRPPMFVDLDGDGESEVLVGIRAVRNFGVTMSDALYCFSREGVLKWKLTPDQQFTFGGKPFSAPWELRDIAVGSAPGPRRLWVAFAHHTWFPGFVLEVDPAGNAFVKYVQSGALYSVAHWATPSGGFLAIGGTSQEHVSATIALIPDTGPPVTFPTEGTAMVACANCPAGLPRRVFTFAPVELTGASRELFPYVATMRTLGAGIKATLRDGQGASVVDINPDFSIDSLQFGQRYWAEHRELEKKGAIDHPAERCPDRERHREIREWTPEGGWRPGGLRLTSLSGV